VIERLPASTFKQNSIVVALDPSVTSAYQNPPAEDALTSAAFEKAVDKAEQPD